MLSGEPTEIKKKHNKKKTNNIVLSYFGLMMGILRFCVSSSLEPLFSVLPSNIINMCFFVVRFLLKTLCVYFVKWFGVVSKKSGFFTFFFSLWLCWFFGFFLSSIQNNLYNFSSSSSLWTCFSFSSHFTSFTILHTLLLVYICSIKTKRLLFFFRKPQTFLCFSFQYLYRCEWKTHKQ